MLNKLGIILAKYFHYFIYFSLLLLLYNLYKTGFLKEFFKNIKENKIFFIIILLLSIIPLSVMPFESMEYYDEQNYILEGQNIVEEGRNSICNTRINGKCIEFNISPHGLGVSSIYSLLYDKDFKTMNQKIGILMQVFHMINGIIIFMIAGNLFKNKTIAKTCSILLVVFPLNIVQANNVMPAIITSTFFLIWLYYLEKINIMGPNIGTNQKRYGITSILASILLSSLRIEYSVMMVFTVAFFFIKNPRLMAKTILYISLFFIGLANSIFYFHQKLMTGLDPKFDTKFLNLTYLGYYLSELPLILISISFIIFLIIKLKNTKNNIKYWIMAAIFIFFILLYSFYNFPDTTRFIIPISTIYILFGCSGLYFISKLITGKHTDTLFIILIILCSGFFINDGIRLKIEDVDKASGYGEFLETIDMHEDKNIYYFTGSYLGQTTRIKNYINKKEQAENILNQKRRLIFMENSFTTIDETEFSEEKYDIKLLHTSKIMKHRIFEIRKR